MSGARLFATRALLPDGWARDVTLVVDDSGHFESVASGTSGDGRSPRESPASGSSVELSDAKTANMVRPYCP